MDIKEANKIYISLCLIEVLRFEVQTKVGTTPSVEELGINLMAIYNHVFATPKVGEGLPDYEIVTMASHLKAGSDPRWVIKEVKRKAGVANG